MDSKSTGITLGLLKKQNCLLKIHCVSRILDKMKEGIHKLEKHQFFLQWLVTVNVQSYCTSKTEVIFIYESCTVKTYLFAKVCGRWCFACGEKFSMCNQPMCYLFILLEVETLFSDNYVHAM
jgi:hypothetical protein